MTGFSKRVAALEHAGLSSMTRWHCLRRYEGETDTDAFTAYEAENGPIGNGNAIMRVIIAKPGERPLRT